MQLHVHVQPRSSRNSLSWEDETLKVKLTAPPVDGAANAALIAFLAGRLSLPRRAITITHGTTSRHKTLEIGGLTLAEAKQRLQL